MIWQRGEIMTLLRWLERLPRTATRTRPRLSLDLAWALLWSAQVDAVEPYLQDAELALEGDSVTSARAELGEVAAIRAELARQRGEIDTAIAMARRALADLPPDAQLVRAATSGLLAQAELLNGDARAAADAFAEAATLGELPHSLSLAMIAQGRLVQVQALQGLLHLAAVTYHQTIISAERYGMEDSPAVGVAQVYMADIRREWNDLAGAEELVRQGIARCTEWPGLAEMALDGYITLARLLQVRGDVDGAFANLDAAEILGRTAHVSQYAERIALTRARVSLLAGDEEGALGWARARESRPPDRVGAAYLDVLEGIMLARLHLVRGATEDALALLAGLLEAAEGGGLAGSAIEILLLRALCLQAQGQTAQAMVALSRALTLAEPQGYRRIFVDEGARMVRLLREARSRDVAGTYVHDLLRAADSAGAVPDDIPELVEPLSARELELLRLLASGLSTSEIAGQLFITPGTARNHLKSIFGKLDVHSRVQAVERARALRML
jgi:LuxR family maltose regulon positive regulatory protein